MSADHELLEDLLVEALRESLDSVEATGQLGLRTNALPTEGEELKWTLNALRRVREGRAGAHREVLAFVGSLDGEQLSEPGLDVDEPHSVAALATEARNAASSERPPLIVYASAADAAGASGLDFFAELTGVHVARALVTLRGPDALPVLARGCEPTAPKLIRDALESAEITALAEYAAAALSADGGHLSGLPLLGLVPDRFAPISKVWPSSSWAEYLARLAGPKATSKLESAARALTGVVTPGHQRALASLLVSKGAARPGRTDAAVVSETQALARGCARFASGRTSDLSALCGLSGALLGLLLRGEKFIPEPMQPEGDPADDSADQSEGGELVSDPEAPDVGEDGADDEVKPPLPDELRESRVLEERGRGAEQLRWENCSIVIENGYPTAHLENPGTGELLTVKPDRDSDAVWQLAVDLVGAEMIAGGARIDVHSGEEGHRLVVSGRGPTPPGPSTHASKPLDSLGSIDALASALAELVERRRVLVEAARSVVRSEPGEEPELDGSDGLDGLVVLARLPLLAAARWEREILGYLEAYQGLVDVAVTGEVFDRLSTSLKGRGLEHLLLLDMVIAWRRHQGPTASRLLPLHPLALAAALEQVRSNSAAQPLGVVVTARSGNNSASLYPTDDPRVFSNDVRPGPGAAGLAHAARLGSNALWALLGHGEPGHLGALQVELRDLESAEDAALTVEALVLACRESFEAGSVASGRFLALWVCLSSSPGEETISAESVIKALSPDVRELLRVDGSADLTVQIKAHKGDKLRPYPRYPHLSVRIREVQLVLGTGTPSIAGDRRCVYQPHAQGSIKRIDPGSIPGLGAWRQLNWRCSLPTEVEAGPPTSDARAADDALLTVFVARGGWPIAARPRPDLLAHDRVGGDFAVALADPEVLDAVVHRAAKMALGSVSRGTPDTVGALQRGLVHLWDLRLSLIKLLEGQDPRHTIASLSKARAFLHDQREGAVLTLTLDGPEGFQLASACDAAFGSRRRADLLRLHAEVGPDGAPTSLKQIEVVELKGGAYAGRVATAAGRERLSRQARLVAARLGAACAASEEPEMVRVQEGLRRVCWLGAGLQLEANRWRPILDEIDQRLERGDELPLSASCWFCLEDASGHEEEGEDEFPQLDVVDGGLREQTESVRWRTIPIYGAEGLPSETSPAKAPLDVTNVPDAVESTPKSAPEPDPAFDGFVGNGAVVARLSTELRYARKVGASWLDQPLGLFGPRSTGKTEVARRVSGALSVPLLEFSESTLRSAEDLARALRDVDGWSQRSTSPALAPPLVVFVDEAHLLSTRAEGSLLKALESSDRTLLSRGGAIDTRQVTFIIATTDPGRLGSAFRSRLLRCDLLEYTSEEVVEILRSKFSRTGRYDAAQREAVASMSDEQLRRVAFAGRLIPRAALDVLSTLGKAVALGEVAVTDEGVSDYLAQQFGADEHGLRAQDYKYLHALYPTNVKGVEALSAELGELSVNLERDLEPFLLRLGLITRGTSGRSLTKAGSELVQRAQAGGRR